MRNPFEIGRRYQRRSTHILHPTVVGIERVTYLVQEQGGQRLASCWLNREMDPHAPTEIWVQDTDRIAERAVRLHRQQSSVHVFIKETKKDRLSAYAGSFIAIDLWTLKTHYAEIKTRENELQGTKGERPLRHVLVMKQVTSNLS